MATIPLIGPTYQSQSVAAECQRTMNWYPEPIESGQGKSPAVLYPTPALLQLLPLGGFAGPSRGLYANAATAVGVLGGAFVEITASSAPGPAAGLTTTGRGNVGVDPWMASFADNGAQGHQIICASGGVVSLFDVTSKAFSVPTLAVNPVNALTFMDGYFIAIAPDKFQISHLNDGTTWDAAAVSARSEGADPFVTGIQNHRELWLLGELTSEVWYNSGATALSPFAPIPGVFLEVGCAARSSLVRFDNSVAWLAKNRNGDRLAVEAQQYAPQRISTYAVETAWRRYPTVSDAVGWTYVQDGHAFWVLTFPTAQATWVYDAATQLWHERGYWNTATGLYEAHRANCHMFMFGQHVVGDRGSGMLYALDLTTAVDNLPDAPNAAIRRLRRTPHLSQENVATSFAKLELELEMGLGTATGQGSNPQAMLRWSDDRGHTWSPEWWVQASPQGTYAQRAEWWRLGRSRDRVFELTVSDPIPWRLTSAYVTASGGTS